MQNKLIIIDFDDCLCQTEAACFALENRVVEKMGLRPMSRERHIANWGKPIESAIAERVSGIDVDRFMSEFKSVFSESVKLGTVDKLSDSTLFTLKRLKLQARKLVVLTSRTGVEVNHLMSATHPLSTLIDDWYYHEKCAGEFGAVKPDPKVVKSILDQHKISSNQAIYVGDSLSDGQCAAGAGVTFVASLESGLRKKSDFAPVPVRSFIHSFSELSDVVEEIDLSCGLSQKAVLGQLF